MEEVAGFEFENGGDNCDGWEGISSVWVLSGLRAQGAVRW